MGIFDTKLKIYVVVATVSLIMGVTTVAIASGSSRQVSNTKQHIAQQKITYSDQNISIKKMSASAKTLQSDIESGQVKKDIVDYVEQAKSVTDNVISLQSVISKQELHSAEAEKANSETKNAQISLKKLINGNYSSASDTQEGSMSVKTVLDNWFSVRNSQTLSGYVSSVNSRSKIDLLFIVRDKDGNTLKYITSEYNPQTKLLTNFTLYNMSNK